MLLENVTILWKTLVNSRNYWVMTGNARKHQKGLHNFGKPPKISGYMKNRYKMLENFRKH